ncbi:MAG: DUF2070 family protein [Candidatus Micrarchaeota archaeon]|nr:DUF2070 family protein [Candidatus Micrarchaeota archaeon]
MQEAKKEALKMTRYFVSLPHPAKTLFAIFAVSFLFGVLLSLVGGGAEPFALFTGGVRGIFLLGFPAILSSLCLFLMRRKAVFRRAAFLSFLSAVIYGSFYLASELLSPHWSGSASLVFIGFGIAFVFWYFVLLVAFDFRKSAFLFSTMQMILFAVFLLGGGGFEGVAKPAELLIKLYLASFVFLTALYVLFFIISAPMKKNLRISSLDALSMFLSQWLYGEKDLEEAFEEIGEEVETIVWIGSFEGRKNRALFVVPYIHYGPFGNLGGSEFTWQISQALSGNGCEVFVFHGTTTHDFNPVSSKEIEKVVLACKRAISRLKLSDARISFPSCRFGSVRASALRINDSAFISYTRAPRTTEDVNFGLGLALIEKAKRHCASACVVDEHNAETGDISSVEVGSPIGFEMLDATEKLFSLQDRQERFLFGCASAALKSETLGRSGLKLALFAKGKKMRAVLLVDANGIIPSFREELNELLAQLGSECGFDCQGEVMTTDTHQINTIRGVLNPLGSEGRGDVCLAVRRMFYDAMRRLEKVRFGSAEERFRIKVFGAGQSAEITSTINAVVALLRLVLPLILIASALLLVWALGKI